MTLDAPINPPDAVAIEHMTGLARGTVVWLSGPALDITLDGGALVHIGETRDGLAPPDLFARLVRAGRGYRIEAAEGRQVWVNGKPASQAVLAHGDTVEFGETGPLCRLRVFAGAGAPAKAVGDILSDTVAYLRVSRQPPAVRAYRAGRALLARLTFETTLLFRLTVVSVLAIFGLLGWQQYQLNQLVQRQIAAANTQLDGVAGALVRTQREALRPSDLQALRDRLDLQVQSNQARLDQLEERSTAITRVIAESSAQVVFLQGMYGYRERDGDRFLRQVIGPDGIPLMSYRGWPMLTLDGDGPRVELKFTGTGFFVGAGGHVVTNRHVALPWEQTGSTEAGTPEGVEPVLLRFIAYRPEASEPGPVEVIAVSETADLAVLRLSQVGASAPGLRLASAPPQSGDDVIVMGYPTGLRSMLAQSGDAFIADLQRDKDVDFWEVAARLARAGYIAPLSSRGIVGQVTAATVVYDAETTSGGSGGPVLDVRGDVVAVNTAILPEFGGSNLGVPAREVRALLDSAGLD